MSQVDLRTSESRQAVWQGRELKTGLGPITTATLANVHIG